jgi:hypothetical protein
VNAVNPDQEVPPEERIKGYRYGRTLVLFDNYKTIKTNNSTNNTFVFSSLIGAYFFSLRFLFQELMKKFSNIVLKRV